ncbi:MAG: single-stranded-DNA-specific exonuclease RecJ [Candidatus Komeilibacteria bacterium CG11_big_fil_rev_8_21_14_0_20_36_20]|uniref:Single-stranded-DNA-specific exonuclease RecJ n=1 Tax=Candidatus Komeilibacteria bacterium CG11_big_fil_rev_8_21_14_0_20_36_20 TaxID=1974477 RepID=A0A2H0NBN7_9BACT|nr:MAG: single-stranded-DNA-specific exonuclease RecJ [Candidatus Komeilibacteria bacterium CG11_big_fil_rev_8_21_14_0_20_36_20]PIR81452.1 MAG: single-stranded-DNA-specific exonuclease RecJ [Candidatus Komeilibacteria bacterium CG10_big_fil_rev_8_21_14_0_10_36_65]PJC55653.1 MAG: single-stranded-DNA-specific exonuclease RecJ [Candidatus Komeilibacteria bacterium CG_4_9_14_0_2_um_filter_36_13]
MSYLWNLPQKIDPTIFDKFPELHPIVAQLLYHRGLTTQEKIDEFLYPDYSQDIHDPCLFKDMDKACDRIFQAIDQQELITIFGDYDADGVSAAVILWSILKNLGAKVDVYLPHREKEGYGLNKNAIKELAQKQTKLLITCDCGISNAEEVDLANSQKIDVIITDHHSIPEEVPKVLAIIHPQMKDEKYPFKFLSGGGVAFKLTQALIKHSGNKISDPEKEIQEKWLLDMVAISTVADMVPLLGENRTLLKYGLIVLKKTQRLGLRKMIEVASIDFNKIDARAISFGLAPRINAAGRMDHANLAFYLLTEENEDKALKLATELNQSNLERQRLTEQIFNQAQKLDIDLKESLLIFYQSDWPAGLTGLVASRLARKYSRPCLVVTDSSDGLVGSGRSIENFNITDALEKNNQLLIKFGGHPQACGFSLVKENFEKLSISMKEIANQQLKDIVFQKKLNIEIMIDFEEINWEIVDILEKFKPFGKDNPEPLFMSKDVAITSARKVGRDGSHWKLELIKGSKKRGAIGFGLSNINLEIGHQVDLVYNLSINEWNGNREIQLIIKDIKHHDKG